MTDIRENEALEQAAQQPTDEVEALRRENEELKKQLEEMRQTLKTTQDELASLKQNPTSGAENPISEEVNVNRLYRFGNSSLEQNEVKDVLKGLKEPYKSEIWKFIRENQIKELQEYLNKLIDENVIDKSGLKKVCEGKGIWVYENGHILTDGKFGPQTMEAIKMLQEIQQEEQQEEQQEQQEEQQEEQHEEQQEEQQEQQEEQHEEQQEQQEEQQEQQGENGEGEIEGIPQLNEARLDNVKIENLGTWDKDGNFDFIDGVIDEETGELILDEDKRLPKLEFGENGLGYFVDNGRLSIGNIEDGVLNGNGVEFYPYGDEYREEGKNPNLYGSRLQGEWEGGNLKNGMQTVRENGLDIHIKVDDGDAKYSYIDGESKLFDLEKIGGNLYLKNGENSLKLKSRYSATKIIKILYDYRDQEGEFSTDMSEGIKSKKLLWKPVVGETKVIYWYTDDLIESIVGSEGSALAFWLNESRKIEQEEQGQQEEQQEEQGQQEEQQEEQGQQEEQHEDQQEHQEEHPVVRTIEE